MCVVLSGHGQIQQVIEHYDKQKLKTMNGNVVSLDEYRKAMSLE